MMMKNFFLRNKKYVFFTADILVIVLVACFSFLLRFEGNIPSVHYLNLYSFIVLSLIVNLPIFFWQRLYHFTWSYVSINDLYQIIKAVTFGTVMIATVLFIFRDWRYFSGFPRSVILINYFFTLLALSFLRIGKRLFTETIRSVERTGQRLLIIGAGKSAEELARSILRTEGYNLIGFIDDAEAKQKIFIHGRRVLGKRKDIRQIVNDYDIEEVVIAFPSAGSKIIRETVEICHEAKVKKIKILPSAREIIEGKAVLSNIRDITIEDLLGRDPVEIDTNSIRNFIYQKRVLITGAAGSIGSELCHQVLKFSPASLIAFDQHETGCFYLGRDLEKTFPNISSNIIVGDICDKKKIKWVFEKFKPNIVFHAAAYKHVPIMETNPVEAVKDNIFGTLIVGQTAAKHKTDEFIFISTDKAINPTSVMGATKRVGEMICLWLNEETTTKFCAVRFGNVLDSQGNVVKIFEDQIKKGGPVEVTHPEMKRYFMVASEACTLVMQAGAIGKGGEVFVLDMGEPVKILNLAYEMINLTGYKANVDIPVVFTHPRPGEKLFEEILTDHEVSTKHQKVFIAKLTKFDTERLKKGLKDLHRCLEKMDESETLNALKRLVPTYKPAVSESMEKRK
ncbi:MAG: nucleoside-diphosphate sugar epimerase/dehydratase [Candidatus Edwardsbacteria bacterium]